MRRAMRRTLLLVATIVITALLGVGALPCTRGVKNLEMSLLARTREAGRRYGHQSPGPPDVPSRKGTTSI